MSAPSPLPPGERLVVCLGYPALQSPECVEQVRAVAPDAEVLTLPVDPEGEWLGVPPAEPHPEPRGEPPRGRQAAGMRIVSGCFHGSALGGFSSRRGQCPVAWPRPVGPRNWFQF